MRGKFLIVWTEKITVDTFDNNQACEKGEKEGNKGDNLEVSPVCFLFFNPREELLLLFRFPRTVIACTVLIRNNLGLRVIYTAHRNVRSFLGNFPFGLCLAKKVEKDTFISLDRVASGKESDALIGPTLDVFLNGILINLVLVSANGRSTKGASVILVGTLVKAKGARLESSGVLAASVV